MNKATFKEAEKIQSKLIILKRKKENIENIIKLSKTQQIKLSSEQYRSDIDVETYIEYSVKIPISYMTKILKDLLDGQLLDLNYSIQQTEEDFNNLK